MLVKNRILNHTTMENRKTSSEAAEFYHIMLTNFTELPGQRYQYIFRNKKISVKTICYAFNLKVKLGSPPQPYS